MEPAVTESEASGCNILLVFGSRDKSFLKPVLFDDTNSVVSPSVFQ